MKRIGIMGGTFNPIHNGHLAIAQAAKEQFSLEKVLFMPSGVPYMKNLQEVLPASVRCEMTALAIREIPYFEVSDIEAVTEGNTYTYRTLEKLKSLHPDTDYHFILGADSLLAIEKWKNPNRIFQNCIILAAARNDKPQTDMETQIAHLKEKFNARISILENDFIDISSSLIRKLVHNRASINGLVPPSIEEYISIHKLYQ